MHSQLRAFLITKLVPKIAANIHWTCLNISYKKTDEGRVALFMNPISRVEQVSGSRTVQGHLVKQEGMIKTEEHQYSIQTLIMALNA